MFVKDLMEGEYVSCGIVVYSFIGFGDSVVCGVDYDAVQVGQGEPKSGRD